ncbi:MAG: hypothetical protein QXW94_06360, partial [Desulfurococcaceae archaeon]
MSPKAVLLAALLLAALSYAQLTVSCQLQYSDYYSRVEPASVVLDWVAKAPAWSDWGVEEVGGWLLSPLAYVQWDRELVYEVRLDYYSPDASWKIDVYQCKLINASNNQVLASGVYRVVSREPPRVYSIVRFVVG